MHCGFGILFVGAIDEVANLNRNNLREVVHGNSKARVPCGYGDTHRHTTAMGAERGAMEHETMMTMTMEVGGWREVAMGRRRWVQQQTIKKN
jgi:hypothetical protein